MHKNIYSWADKEFFRILAEYRYDQENNITEFAKKGTYSHVHTTVHEMANKGIFKLKKEGRRVGVYLTPKGEKTRKAALELLKLCEVRPKWKKKNKNQ